MKTIKMKWTGIRPLVMNNGAMVDRANPLKIKIDRINKKKSKDVTDTENEERDHLQWEGALYWSDELGPIIPADNIERCLQLGAQKSQKGKSIAAAVFCTEPEFAIEYDGPKDKNKMYLTRKFELRKPVVVAKQRVMKVRPMIQAGWVITPEFEFDDKIINEKDLVKAAEDAGALIGLGDWRPKFGRFIVEIVS